jgi:hypothetical protein
MSRHRRSSMRTTVRRTIALGPGAFLMACGAPVVAPGAPPAPNELVIAHFDSPRELALERGPGDTVRMRRVTSVVGRLREVRGDTSWIVASRVRALHDDGQGLVSGWATAVVDSGRTRVVPLSRDTYTDRQGAKQFGALAAIAATVGGTVALIIIWGMSHDPS